MLRIKFRSLNEKVGSITNVGPLQRSRDVIDVTTYDSPAIEKELTLEDNGDIELTFNYRENDDSQKLFVTKFFALPTPEVKVVYPPLTVIEEDTVTVSLFGTSSENCIIPPLKRLDVPLESGR
jgi:hypothetical protein